MLDGEAQNVDRRAAYLRLTAALLVAHLEPLVQAWTPGQPGNYRAEFVANPETALASMMTGMGMLAGDELAGERIAVAWETRDPEDEQSCFSDTTHLDILGNAQGIRDAWYGTLGGGAGPGPASILRERNPTVAAQMDEAIGSMMGAVEAIPVPFDAAIQAPDGDPRRDQVEQAIEALEKQAQNTVVAASSLGLGINLEGG